MSNSILVVDGSTLSRQVITRRLDEALPGARIATAGSAAEALARLGEEGFSLVTTALMLPDADGLDLCRRMRHAPRHLHTPIIVISSDADQRLVHEGFAAGVTDYFDKSLGFQAFGQFIKAFLERHAALRGRVLYIEDSRTAATVTKGALEQQGLEVVHALSVEEGLEHLAQVKLGKERPYDIVLTDFFLKGQMTGGDLLYVLRACEHYSKQELPVLVVTGNEDAAAQAEVFRAGANDFITKPIINEVLVARVHSMLLIKHQFDALRRQAADIERLATTDALTGVRNRRYLVDEGQRFLSQGSEAWAMFVDLDHFKQINDTQGPLVGDQVLMAMGDILNRLFPDGLPARYSGEEFVVLLHGADVPQRAEQLRAEVERLKPTGIDLTVSLGLAAVADHPGHDLNALLRIADKALFGAKGTGRNRVCINRSDGTIIPFPAKIA